MKFLSGFRTHLVVAGAAMVTFGAVVAAATIQDGDVDQPNLDLDVRQTAISESQSIRFSLHRAAFSGTGTFFEVTAEVVGPSYGESVARVEVSPNSIAPSSVGLAPGSPGIRLVAGRPGVVRLAPISLADPPQLAFTQVQLYRADGTNETVTGTWALNVDMPDDIRGRLRTEHLAGPSVESSGVRVSVEGAVRSVAETVVTVRFSSAKDVSQLGEPALFDNGRRLSGGRISSQEQGTLVSYSFPPTEFGHGVRLSFGPFVTLGQPTNGSVRVDLGAVIARHSLSGESGEFAPVLASDNLDSSGAALSVTRLSFSDLYNSSSRPGKNRTLSITLAGAFPGRPSEVFSVTRSDGHPLEVVTGGVGFSKDAAGVVSEPRTDAGVLYANISDLDEPVTLTVVGRPQDVIRGEWQIDLTATP